MPLLLAACGLSPEQKADYARVQASGVSSAIYDKMVHGDALSLYDIKALSRAHVSDGIILRYLRDQGTVYFLNSDDVASLRKAGVSQSIIDYMLQTSRGYGPYPYPSYRTLLGRSLLGSVLGRPLFLWRLSSSLALGWADVSVNLPQVVSMNYQLDT